MKSIAVAILNWNGKHLLEEFLPSVVANSEQGDIIVIDNASTDNSIPWMRENHPDVQIIELEKNSGYAGGYNKALKQISHPYVVLLNSDVEVTPNWLEPILTKFESDSSVAAIQPKIKAYKNKEYFEYAGASGGYIDYLGYPFCRGRVFDHLEKDDGQYDEEVSVFWATGACLAVRSSAYHEVGELDPRFFAHMEEIDLCWRFHRWGYSCWAIPSSTVYHLGGGTLQGQSPQKTYLNFRNNLILLAKNLPMRKVLYLVLLRMILDGLAGIQFLLNGMPQHTLAVVKGHMHFYGQYGSVIKARAGQFPWPIEGMLHSSIVKQAFVKRVKRFSDLPKDLFAVTQGKVDGH